MEQFGARLHRALAEHGPLCVGIDPHDALLNRWGLGVDPAGLARFSEIAVEALGGRVAVVKPQSAFYERFGSRGIAILESTIRQFKDCGTLVLLDVKRGDIGSTVAAYAAAYLDPASPLYVDAVTASPYLGVGALAPMVDAAYAGGSGVFVLALTSNPEGASVQRARGADGRTVAQAVLDEITQLNRGAQPLGSVGAVVGATIGGSDHDLSRLGGPILVPGMGAQGGRPDDLKDLAGGNRSAILPSYSREVLAEGPDVTALRDAAARARDACAAVLVVPG
jgi:orotidine-5'-phosphate decarboxylase